jgi:hypothetical protein
MKSRILITVLTIMVFLSLVGCGGSYYKVKDPTSGTMYYTKDIKQKDSSVILEDANTGSTVTLQNSEVTEINEEEFKANTKKKE